MKPAIESRYEASCSRYGGKAELLRRVFREEVLECNRCGGRRVVLAFLIEPSAVKAVLEHLRLPTTGPPVTPALGSPQMELVPWPDVPDDSPQCP